MWLVYTREAPQPQGRVKLGLYFKTMAQRDINILSKLIQLQKDKCRMPALFRGPKTLPRYLKSCTWRWQGQRSKLGELKTLMGEVEEGLVSGRGEECAQDILSTYMKSRLNTTHCNKIKFKSFFSDINDLLLPNQISPNLVSWKNNYWFTPSRQESIHAPAIRNSRSWRGTGQVDSVTRMLAGCFSSSPRASTHGG